MSTTTTERDRLAEHDVAPPESWLAARKVPRRTLIEIAVAALRSGEVHPPLVAFLATALATRAAWEKGRALYPSAPEAQAIERELRSL